MHVHSYTFIQQLQLKVILQTRYKQIKCKISEGDTCPANITVTTVAFLRGRVHIARCLPTAVFLII